MKRKVLYLYTEVADYFLAGVTELSQHCNVKIIRWPVNDEAPFKISENNPFEMVDKSTFKNFEDLFNAIDGFNPDLIICSGWMDKDYVKICKRLKNIKQIIAFDNHWVGGIKQQLAALIAKKTLLKTFDYAWVPGPPQVEFAKKLGFKKKDILDGFYCANTTLFTSKTEEIRKIKCLNGLPQRFLYVGRYVNHKGIFEMWNAFERIKEKYPDWELWCVGTGDEFERKIEGKGIKHFGFLQPEALQDVIAQSGAFILPSRFEPWGVVVHEYAISGFPLLVSEAVGAASRFLKNRVNGMIFKPNNEQAIFEAMEKYILLSENDKIEMSKKSHEIGTEYTTKDWSNTITKVLQKIT